MTDNGGGFGEGSGIFFAFLIFALFAFGGSNAWGFGRNGLTGAGAVALQNSNQTRDILALQTENARLYADKSNLIQSIGFGERFCGLEKQLAACCCSTQNDLNLILSKLPATGTTGA